MVVSSDFRGSCNCARLYEYLQRHPYKKLLQASIRSEDGRFPAVEDKNELSEAASFLHVRRKEPGSHGKI